MLNVRPFLFLYLLSMDDFLLNLFIFLVFDRWFRMLLKKIPQANYHNKNNNLYRQYIKVYRLNYSPNDIYFINLC